MLYILYHLWYFSFVFQQNRLDFEGRACYVVVWLLRFLNYTTVGYKQELARIFKFLKMGNCLYWKRWKKKIGVYSLRKILSLYALENGLRNRQCNWLLVNGLKLARTPVWSLMSDIAKMAKKPKTWTKSSHAGISPQSTSADTHKLEHFSENGTNDSKTLLQPSDNDKEENQCVCHLLFKIKC